MNEPSKGPAYADLADLPENQRIKVIGRVVAVEGKQVAVALEDEPKKIARYRRKLEERHPGLMEFEQRPGLVPETVLLIVKPKTQNVPNN